MRMDVRTLDSAKLLPVDPIAGEVCQSVPWKVHHARDFASTQHVNIQELEVIAEELRGAVRRSLAPSRMVNGTDSSVSLGCWAKGRSSSIRFN